MRNDSTNGNYITLYAICDIFRLAPYIENRRIANERNTSKRLPFQSNLTKNRKRRALSDDRDT